MVQVRFWKKQRKGVHTEEQKKALEFLRGYLRERGVSCNPRGANFIYRREGEKEGEVTFLVTVLVAPLGGRQTHNTYSIVCKQDGYEVACTS